MTRDELLEKLRACAEEDPEIGHLKADTALIEYINDPEIDEAYISLTRWYV